MEQNSFIKGLEVGWVLRGWRIPDKGGDGGLMPPGNAKETAEMFVKNAHVRFPTISDVGLTVGLVEREVVMSSSTRVGGAKWETQISVASGAHTRDGACLGYVMCGDNISIPRGGSIPQLLKSPGTYLRGSHDVLILRGDTWEPLADARLYLTTAPLPSAFIPGISWMASSLPYKVVCQGTGWNGVSGAWTVKFAQLKQ